MAGISMIEALVGMLLIALWLLSSAGLQVSSLKFQAGAASRYTAVALASELGERMEANAVGAVGTAYVLAPTDAVVSAQADCTAIACAPDLIASYDMAQWTARVVDELKQLKSMSVVASLSATGQKTYTISISWDEPRGRQTYASGGSATSETMSYVTTKVLRDASL